MSIQSRTVGTQYSIQDFEKTKTELEAYQGLVKHILEHFSYLEKIGELKEWVNEFGQVDAARQKEIGRELSYYFLKIHEAINMIGPMGDVKAFNTMLRLHGSSPFSLPRLTEAVEAFDYFLSQGEESKIIPFFKISFPLYVDGKFYKRFQCGSRETSVCSVLRRVTVQEEKMREGGPRLISVDKIIKQLTELKTRAGDEKNGNFDLFYFTMLKRLEGDCITCRRKQRTGTDNRKRMNEAMQKIASRYLDIDKQKEATSLKLKIDKRVNA